MSNKNDENRNLHDNLNKNVGNLLDDGDGTITTKSEEAVGKNSKKDDLCLLENDMGPMTRDLVFVCSEKRIDFSMHCFVRKQAGARVQRHENGIFYMGPAIKHKYWKNKRTNRRK